MVLFDLHLGPNLKNIAQVTLVRFRPTKVEDLLGTSRTGQKLVRYQPTNCIGS